MGSIALRALFVLAYLVGCSKLVENTVQATPAEACAEASADQEMSDLTICLPQCADTRSPYTKMCIRACLLEANYSRTGP